MSEAETLENAEQPVAASASDTRAAAIAKEEFAVSPGKESLRDQALKDADNQGWALMGMAEHAARIMQYEMRQNAQKKVPDLINEAIIEASLDGHLQLAELSSILAHLQNYWAKGNEIGQRGVDAIFKAHVQDLSMPSAVDAYLVSHPRGKDYNAFVEAWKEAIDAEPRKHPKNLLPRILADTFEALIKHPDFAGLEQSVALNRGVDRLCELMPESAKVIDAWRTTHMKSQGSLWVQAVSAGDNVVSHRGGR